MISRQNNNKTQQKFEHISRDIFYKLGHTVIYTYVQHKEDTAWKNTK